VARRWVLVSLLAYGVFLADCAAPSTPVSSKSSTSTVSPSTTTRAAPTTTLRPQPPIAPSDGIPKPDARLTPGATFPVTAAQVCVPGYSKSVRFVSDAEKNAVFAEYGISHHAPYSYEVDHLISLELGGSNDIRNLWPEPYTGVAGAHAKDAIENELHAQVCAGSISLAAGQAEIVRWWTLPGVSPSPAAPGPTTTSATRPPTSVIVGSVHPGAFCAPLGATGSTSAGTRMVCSDHSVSGTPYKSGTLHWHDA
jgi:hypothetical protein